MTQRNEAALGVVATGIVIGLLHTFMGAPIAGLSTILIVALGLWLTTLGRTDLPVSPRLRAVYTVAVFVQCLHLFEEFLTDFHREFPALFGFEWSQSRFLTLNLIALAIFVAAVPGLRRHSRLAVLPVWILAVAGVANGLAHPAMSLVRGAYFSGTATAPLQLAIGVLILHQLSASRRAVEAP